jgi:alanine-glyoxylate transaminase/serine-glyoxylate transaminase/serine-pyruvate transaminase
MGLGMLPEDSWWLPSLNAVRVPDDVDAHSVIRTLLSEHGIEISGGFGPLAGRIFRIGCMGHSCRPGNVLALLPALAEVLEKQGFKADVAGGLAAAQDAMRG